LKGHRTNPFIPVIRCTHYQEDLIMSRYLVVFIATFNLLIFLGILSANNEVQAAPNDKLPRIALVIGNGTYHNAKIGKRTFDSLSNPVNDAIDMAQALEKLGFTVILKTNAKTRLEMEEAVFAFWQRLRDTASPDVGLFYFSGHGFQYQNTNYLVPVEAAIPNHLNIKSKALETDYVLRHLEDANSQGVNLMILDACRESIPPNFFAVQENKGLFAPDLLKAGFANMKAPVGSLIAYSTAPNTTSWGGLPGERNSVYTKYLLAQLQQQPYLNITHLLMKVRQGVIGETKNEEEQQVPWEHISLTDPFCFQPPCAMSKEQQRSRRVWEEKYAQLQQKEKELRDKEAILKQQAAMAEQQRQQAVAKVPSLLLQCEAYFQADYLTTSPTGDATTAFACYQQVLQQSQGNAQALAGLEKITARYVELTEWALSQGRLDSAKKYVARLRQVNPESPKLVALAAQLENTSGPAGKIFRDRLKDGSLGPEMVWIPAGSFQMGDIQGGGDDDEQPVHRVSVEKFAMGRYEITFAEYDKFAQATGREKPDDRGWGRGNRPVINVYWHDVKAYADWLSEQTGQNYRLPTEAEWEYAARAGTNTKYWWGNEIGKNRAACDGCGAQWGWDAKKMTAQVGSFSPNPFGLHDTVGNVWEWTCSEYEDTYQGKEKRCVSNAGLFALRGGSWLNNAWGTRAAVRGRYGPTDRDDFLGARLARHP
jgi:formylglycine-generating enzyme required for sulfatase activity